jgi:hypothetical protein
VLGDDRARGSGCVGGGAATKRERESDYETEENPMKTRTKTSG